MAMLMMVGSCEAYTSQLSGSRVIARSSVSMNAPTPDYQDFRYGSQRSAVGYMGGANKGMNLDEDATMATSMV